jgi:Ca-activated chloride channel family protein
MIRLLALGLALATLAPQFRTEANAVRIEALVLEDGRPVPGLTAADFSVTDNGRPQTIRVRPLEREPIDVALALDVSDSVRGARLEHLRAAALALVAQLTPADRATLLTFDHTLSLGPRDAAPDALAPRLRALTPQGRTSLVDAVTTALVWSTGRERPMLVFVFSDGEDTASWTRPTHALALAASSDAVVDVIVAGQSMAVSSALQAGRLLPPTAYQRFLGELAATTGGRVRNGGAGARLAAAFKASIEQFRARYEITYAPSSDERGWHAIEVRVPGRRGATIHARRGYQR